MNFPARSLRCLVATSFLSMSFVCLFGCHAQAADTNPQLLFKTTAGDILIELYPKEAPISTENFLTYAKNGFFEGTIFHRNIPGFVIQGGGFTKDAKKKETLEPIKNEADNGLRNEKYTLSMARTSDPNSATSQFFINVKDNRSLDRDFPRGDGFGYAVFGKVVKGQEVVEKIVKARTKTLFVSGQPMKDWPSVPVVVEKVELIEDAKANSAETIKN